MALIGTSLSAVTATGPGSAVTFDKPHQWLWQILITGSPANVTLNLEGSVDGVNFCILDSFTATAGVAANLSQIRRQVPSGLNTSAAATALALRANLVSLSGGVSPTVTATVAAADWD